MVPAARDQTDVSAPTGGDAAHGLGPFQFTYRIPPDWPGRTGQEGFVGVPLAGASGARQGGDDATSGVSLAVANAVRSAAWLLASLGESADNFCALDMAVGTDGARIRILR